MINELQQQVEKIIQVPFLEVSLDQEENLPM